MISCTISNGYHGKLAVAYHDRPEAGYHATVVDGTASCEEILATSYVALGDSIPYGYYYTSLFNYLLGGTDSYSYIEQFRDAMRILPGNYHDESASGNNTIDVLKQLSDFSLGPLISQADVITLILRIILQIITE